MNFEPLWGTKNRTPHLKDVLHDRIAPSHRPKKDRETEERARRRRRDGPEEPKQYVNPAQNGVKSDARYVFTDVPPLGACAVLPLKMPPRNSEEDPAHAISDDFRKVMCQALSGIVWSKQDYQSLPDQWIQGDPARHGYPDKWENPFFPVWDSTFYNIPLAMVDPTFAKKHLD
ncbi:hypothetical protein CALVIDRAFT_569443 [Calocera viscosa TUFC12733]|uniref:Uncharacterized protein n=1 Tax=Calocera viscosa (strain TUFC12733) TaxID=1330018 RepID=A0A167FZS7_CALVF|nr:hypothetical protein CALVIDRAFT_569443 [Calocera viscosa TUFC12733]